VTDPDEKNRLPDGSVRGGMYGGSGIPRMTSRSATATPTGSPKRRHLPQIPSALQQTSFARVRQVLYQILIVLKMNDMMIFPFPPSARTWKKGRECSN
jgi:hypothetical protein